MGDVEYEEGGVQGNGDVQEGLRGVGPWDLERCARCIR